MPTVLVTGLTVIISSLVADVNIAITHFTYLQHCFLPISVTQSKDLLTTAPQIGCHGRHVFSCWYFNTVSFSQTHNLQNLLFLQGLGNPSARPYFKKHWHTRSQRVLRMIDGVCKSQLHYEQILSSTLTCNHVNLLTVYTMLPRNR